MFQKIFQFTTVAGGFSNGLTSSQLAAGLENITAATSRVQVIASNFAVNAKAIELRLERNQTQKTHFLNTADTFNSADLDEEATIVRASETRYQLAIQSLTFRSRRDQLLVGILQS
ncbi:MAG: hypothetical protein AAF352_07460 [Pseudomonadota bacterium]